MFQDCYILDTVTSGIFVWIGKQCTKDEKVEAMKLAQKFLVTNSYPAWTKVCHSNIHTFSYHVCMAVVIIELFNTATNIFWPSD
jgi:hypothetical protein